MVERSSEDVKPLSRAEVERWDVDVLFLVWLVAQSTEDLIDGVLAAAGLSADEYALFSMLRATRGITPTELARWMAAPPTTVSAYLKRFTARGLVTRVPNPDDGRSSLVRLTPAGLLTHDAARRHFGPVRADVVERLAGDHSAVADALTILRTVIDQLRAEASSQPDHTT
jgi:DNA-binding MarR family transcriptional regulator